MPFMGETNAISGLRRKFDEFSSDPTMMNLVEVIFQIRRRETTVMNEVYCGLIHFLSVATCLAINPSQLHIAGYDKAQVATSTALSCSVSCLLIGFLGNLPFIPTPVLATSIYFSVFMQSQGYSCAQGNTIVLVYGFLMILSSNRHVTSFIAKLIPLSVRLGICIGMALLVSLQTLHRLHLVEKGEYTILTLGNVWTVEVLIAVLAFVIIGVLHHFRVKGAYVSGLLFGSLCFWLVSNTWPTQIAGPMSLDFELDVSVLLQWQAWQCVIDLFLISSVLLAGLSITLSSLARLEAASSTLASASAVAAAKAAAGFAAAGAADGGTQTDGVPSIGGVGGGNVHDMGVPPRRRWLYFSCGLGTVVGAAMGTGPILISPESIPAISAGARTGLSTVVCGVFFALCASFYPLWASIPETGTGPVILIVAVLLFGNTGRVDWGDTTDSLVVFITSIFSAFTFSIFHGVVFGLGAYFVMILGTGEIKGIFRQAFCPSTHPFQPTSQHPQTPCLSPDRTTRIHPQRSLSPHRPQVPTEGGYGAAAGAIVGDIHSSEGSGGGREGEGAERESLLAHSESAALLGRHAAPHLNSHPYTQSPAKSACTDSSTGGTSSTSNSTSRRGSAVRGRSGDGTGRMYLDPPSFSSSPLSGSRRSVSLGGQQLRVSFSSAQVRGGSVSDRGMGGAAAEAGSGMFGRGLEQGFRGDGGEEEEEEEENDGLWGSNHPPTPMEVAAAGYLLEDEEEIERERCEERKERRDREAALRLTWERVEERDRERGGKVDCREEKGELDGLRTVKNRAGYDNI